MIKELAAPRAFMALAAGFEIIILATSPLACLGCLLARMTSSAEGGYSPQPNPDIAVRHPSKNDSLKLGDLKKSTEDISLQTNHSGQLLDC